MATEKLSFGMAYHGNRMPHHARADFEDMAANGIDTVVHMLSHTDWNRHLKVMKELVEMTRECGMDVWVDNWGIAGSPGDTAHFLGYHPEAHMIYSDGSFDPRRPCLYHPAFRAFTKEWVDAAAFIGGETIFWDEPHLPLKKADGKTFYACTCPTCRERFFARYGHEMPEEPDEETMAFGAESVVDYFREVTEYSASKGMKNTVCVMLGTYGMNLENAGRVAALPHMASIGSDPYWIDTQKKNPALDVYDFVFEATKQNLAFANRYGKDHNVWIQTYQNPRGKEEDIIAATEAAYDAGARRLFAWGYYGSESNDYGAENGALVRAKTFEAFRRVRDRDRDAYFAAKRREKGVN